MLKQLPAKEEKVEFCAMSDQQQQLYNALMQKLKGSTNGESMLGRGGRHLVHLNSDGRPKRILNSNTSSVLRCMDFLIENHMLPICPPQREN